MINKTIQYTDFNGVEREEEFYFNLTEAELAEMNFTFKGGLKGYLEAIIRTQDTSAIAELFKSIINKAYGLKSADGRKFVKSAEILDDFIYTQAYSNLYMSLLNDANEASAFINGIVPADIAKRVSEVSEQKPELIKK